MPLKNGVEHTATDLDKLYKNAVEVDNWLFSEMRSNILLISGDHYLRSHNRFFQRVRSANSLSDRQKLRLTKNHVQRITKTYSNTIISTNPNVGFSPHNENELTDQKSAKLYKSVWMDAYHRYGLEKKIELWADDITSIGEVATKIFYDPTAGPIKAFEQLVNENGENVFKEEMLPDPATGSFTVVRTAIADESKPIYRGEFIFENIYGFNLLRAPETQSMEESPYLVIRKMVNTDVLKGQYKDDEKKLLAIESTEQETFLVFDGALGQYRESRNETLVKEFYFRPSPLYPYGFFYIMAATEILEQGELPGAVFPIAWEAWDLIQTTPRGRSPVKTMRPYQAEINRSASKIAEHQITLGDDKLLIQNGSKVSPGVSLPGVRTINHTGAKPEILPGRDGSQYLAYMQSQITEMYDVMELQERTLPNEKKGDAFAQLFQAASQKRKFQRYIRRFEKFLLQVAQIYLDLAKFHLTEDTLIRAVGADEMVNITEFKNVTDTKIVINIEAQSDDIEEKMGKQLVLNHALQFAGQKLDREDIGRLMRTMPFANFGESFSELTLDYDSATNTILALDRGEPPIVTEFDPHVYMVKRLVSRMRQADFKNLGPEVQQLYQETVSFHQKAEAENQAKIQAAQDGFIPTDGPLVTVDFYVRDPKDPLKTRRAKLPHNAIQWLISRLETQGQGQEQLEDMNRGALAQLSDQILQTRQSGGAPGQGPPPGGGAAIPQGVPDGTASPFSVI